MNGNIVEAHTEGIVSRLDNVKSLAVTILTSIKGALIYRRDLGDEVLRNVLRQINWFFRNP